MLNEHICWHTLWGLSASNPTRVGGFEAAAWGTRFRWYTSITDQIHLLLSYSNKLSGHSPSLPIRAGREWVYVPIIQFEVFFLRKFVCYTTEAREKLRQLCDLLLMPNTAKTHYIEPPFMQFRVACLQKLKEFGKPSVHLCFTEWKIKLLCRSS